MNSSKNRLTIFLISAILLFTLAFIPLLYSDYRARMVGEEERGRLVLALAAENLAHSSSQTEAYSYLLGLSRREGYQLTLADRNGLVFLDSWGEEDGARYLTITGNFCGSLL